MKKRERSGGAGLQSWAGLPRAAPPGPVPELGSPGKQAGQGSSGSRKSLVGMDWREEGRVLEAAARGRVGQTQAGTERAR